MIAVDVPTHANAFAVFETLNDRGLSLSAADLLKNYLFMLADDRLAEVQENWTRMLGALEAVSDENTALAYIRHYWLSARGNVRARALYATIKSQTTSKQAAIELSAGLAENARAYAALLNPSHELWKELGGSGREFLRTLQFLRMEQNRPLLLAVLRAFSPKEANEALRMVVSWSVRFLIVGGLGGGTMEKHYGERAREVRDGEVKNAKELAARMASVVPTDGEFRNSFSTARVQLAWLARYYLRTLERARQGEEEPELVPNDNEEQLTLEHVLPENPGADWAHLEPELSQALYKRIGNLTLMQRRTNSGVGSAGFAAKRQAYSDSRLALTKGIATYTTWGKDEIDKRQSELADLALQAWSL